MCWINPVFVSPLELELKLLLAKRVFIHAYKLFPYATKKKFNMLCMQVLQ